jgi:hypothetical protein
MMAEVANTIVTWTPWFPHKIIVVAIICIIAIDIVILLFVGRPDFGLVGIHKEINHIVARECLASTEVIGDLTFGENLPRRVYIESYDVITILKCL